MAHIRRIKFAGPELVRGRSRFEVVAGVLFFEGQIALFRRSGLVTGDVGKWHCITGYLPSGESPLRQTLSEVREEAGITATDLRLTAAAKLEHRGDDGNLWRVHAFAFRCLTQSVRLNWEHDAALWIPVGKHGALATAPWLESVVQAVSVLDVRPTLRELRPINVRTIWCPASKIEIKVGD